MSANSHGPCFYPHTLRSHVPSRTLLTEHCLEGCSANVSGFLLSQTPWLFFGSCAGNDDGILVVPVDSCFKKHPNFGAMKMWGEMVILELMK